MSTYEDFQNEASSEKIGLVRLEASRRLMGWTLYSGSIYQIPFSDGVISTIEDSGTAVVAVSDIASVIANRYYFDRINRILYLRTADSVNPNSKFIGITFILHFANVPVILPHDLSAGYDVEWLPYLEGTSDFGVELDNQNQLGVAIEGSGDIRLKNDQAYWSSRFDKFYFENQRAFIYSWNRSLPVSEAKIVYRGRVQKKSYTLTSVRFQLKDFLNELRAPVDLVNLETIVGARIPDKLLQAKKRRIYGYVYGHRPTNIDQVLDGYPLTGTFSVTLGSPTVTGTGTLFLKQLSPGDEITFGTDEDSYSVESIASNTSLTLTDDYEGSTLAGLSATVEPSHPKRWTNREFVIAGHALRQPETTVVEAFSLISFRVTSTQDFEAGDPITVNGELSSIDNISGDIVKLNTSLVTLPTAGDPVVRPGLTDVYLDNKLLILDRDYTYNKTTAMLTLDELAEFNVASTTTLAGTLTFTIGLRSVTGTGTTFTAEIKPGDWIKASGEFDYFEVLQVNSDTSLDLRTASTYTATASGYIRTPAVYNEGESALSCDVMGLTDDGTSDGALLKKAPEIVEDILERQGLTAYINAASFTTANDLTEHPLGLVIPAKYTDTQTPKARDVINRINQSVFGALIQDQNFELAYRVLEPEREDTALILRESDILKFSIESNSDRIVKTTKINHTHKEYDPFSLAEITSTFEVTSDNAQYLARTMKEFLLDTYLVREDSALIFAYRWAFILEIASAVIKADTKLQAALLQVTDRVTIAHEKLYERIGSTIKQKVAGVQVAKKSLFDVSLELEDLANAFSRCSTITENDADDYDLANDDQLIRNGYITDNFGMMNNNPDTFGVHLIW